jgi:hypothetical protein
MSNPYDAPKSNDPPLNSSAANQGDATGGVIPYKNPNALLAYYFSIGTLLCCITPLPLGIIPMVMGIMGLRARARNPVIKGSAHAWIGIVLGGLSAAASMLMAVTLIIAAINGEFQ